MLTALPHITEHQQELLRGTISQIVEATKPEKIICYGIRTMSSELWSSFVQELDSRTITSIDLLIILHEKDKNKRESVSDIVENLSNESIKLITVVHSIDAVNTNLKEGNPFFTTLYRKGIFVYDNNRVPLIVPANGDFNDNQQTAFNESIQRKSDLAQMFYETACDCAAEGRNDVAVFMLHQAVELTCIALLRTCLGYKPTTHSIKKLLMLIENITLDVNQLFPRSTKQELEIFNILQRAYSDVRYKEVYIVSADKVFTLIERVSEFRAMALTLCQDKWREAKQTT